MTPKRILLVDDDLLGSSLMREVLKSDGYDVAAVISGEKALARLEAEPAPDLILMDIDLSPGRMDGTEAARRISERADVPVVFLSAHADAQTIMRARSAAKYGFVHKVPGNEMFLLATVEMALELHGTEARRRTDAELWRSFVEAIPGPAFLMRTDGTLVMANSVFWDHFGKTAEEVLGQDAFAWLPPDIAARRRAKLDEAVATAATVTYEDERDGRRFRSILCPILGPAGKPDRVAVISQDITEAFRREQWLRESERRLAALMANVPGIIYRCRNDRDWTMEFLSEGCLELTGYEPAELLGNAGFSYGALILPEDKDKVGEEVHAALAGGKAFRLVYRIRKKAGDIRWVSERGRGIAAPNGSTARLEGIILDITDRRKTDELVEKGLQEKTVLLKELQHRVKNNLAVISSLLNLESERLHDPRDREIFRMMRNRIRSMALIYERLYRSDDVRAVDARAYLEGLAKQLFESNQVRPGQVRLGLRFESFPLDLRKAVSCGLIFTELIANAMKHAFPGGRKGDLEVSAIRSGEGFVLAVRDDGVGFDVPATGRESDGFGLKLVRSQVEQMDGKLKVVTNPGALFEIEVPVL